MSEKNEAQTALKVGDKAPAFELLNSDGVAVRLADFVGKKVVLYFYPKDNTSGCTKEACEFSELYGEFKKAGTIVVGVSPDGVKSHVKFGENYGLKHILLSDESKETLQAYGVWQKKKMYGREYFGVVRTTFIIDENGVIAAIYEKVKPAGHAQNVLNTLNEQI